MSHPLRKEITVKINDRIGLHTRTASIFARHAARFACSITVSHADKRDINGKSMLGLMYLGVKSGGELTIVADGEDAGAALEELKNLVEKEFCVQG